MSFVPNEILLRLKKSGLKYGRNLVDIATRAILLVICASILNIIVLYFYNILWHIYGLTYIGKQFVALHPRQTQMITAILSHDIASLSHDTTLGAFVICMAISAGCQVFYLSRFFYQSRGKIGKLILWGLPLTALVSMYANDQHGFDSWTVVIPITIVPGSEPMDPVTFHPIGVIRSPFKEPSGVPIQTKAGNEHTARVEVLDEFVEGLSDLDGFSHILLLCHLHRSEGYDLKVIPFLDDVERGVFSTRGHGTSGAGWLETLSTSG